MKKTLLVYFFLLMLFLLSCGIEDYPIIPPIPQSNISQEMNNRAVVRIPNDNADNPFFTNFAVFYRIYVSDIRLDPTGYGDSSGYSTINPALASDFNSINTYIDSTTIVNINMETLFRGQGYKYLALQNDNNISGVLSPSVLGTTIVFDFSSSRTPTMSVGSNTYTLWRSNDGGQFSPLPPDRLFINREELYRSENINATINADVVAKRDVTGGRLYTYAAMFIVAVGINPTSYSYIYSTPALIHVFLLPD